MNFVKRFLMGERIKREVKVSEEVGTLIKVPLLLVLDLFAGLLMLASLSFFLIGSDEELT